MPITSFKFIFISFKCGIALPRNIKIIVFRLSLEGEDISN